MDFHATAPLFAGYDPAEGGGAVKPPMHLASTFCFPSAAAAAAHFEASQGLREPVEGYIYSRLSNPTLEVAEKRHFLRWVWLMKLEEPSQSDK